MILKTTLTAIALCGLVASAKDVQTLSSQKTGVQHAKVVPHRDGTGEGGQQTFPPSGQVRASKAAAHRDGNGGTGESGSSTYPPTGGVR
jgi:hypothetical protein